MNELKCEVCGCKATEKLAQVQIRARFDCDICNGTGESYLSGDVYGSCDCLYDCGPWVKCIVCDSCKHTERMTAGSMATIGNAEDYIDKVLSDITKTRTSSESANN